MTFAAQLLLDRSVFVNPDEFGQRVSIDGAYEFDAVLTQDRQRPNPATGVYQTTFDLRCQLEDLLERPVIGQVMTVDERNAEVVGVHEAGGMLTISMRWWES